MHMMRWVVIVARMTKKKFNFYRKISKENTNWET